MFTKCRVVTVHRIDTVTGEIREVQRLRLAAQTAAMTACYRVELLNDYEVANGHYAWTMGAPLRYTN